ncbi:hypothetical protein [Glutamicibacter ardleyensis]|uniref:hypothetical protein n=1 Tax=Glutamicibacter ardleyensis TaxID=225894 RepID=UPI003FD67F5A
MDKNIDLSQLRKHYLTEPGTALIITEDPVGRLYAHSQFAEDSGLQSDNITLDSVCAVPLPIVTEDMNPERPYAQVNPAMMWHPVFWLPARLTERQAYTDDNGEPFIEDDKLWSLRVSLELLSGLIYDPESGWLNVMELIGIDVENPADLHRIRSWQKGAQDDSLDSINLDELMRDDREPDWALETARSLIDDVDGAQWSVHANALAEYLSSGLQTLDSDDLLQRLHECSILLDTDFSEVTGELFENLDTIELADDLTRIFEADVTVPFEALKDYAVPMIGIFSDISLEFADSLDACRQTLSSPVTN